MDNLCELIGGGTPSRQNSEYFNGDILWLTPTEIPKDQIIRINDSREKITKLGLKKSSAKIIPTDSVLLTSRASIGYVAIVGTDVTTNQGFASFVCNDTIFNYYLAYWLFGKKNFLESLSTGTTFKEISKAKLRVLKIPLPPFPEQKRIVSKIESIFAHIDAGKEKLENVKVLLKQSRQSVLKERFDKLGKQHDSQKLDELSVKITDGTHFTPKYEEVGIPFISVKDIRNERIYFDNCKYVSKETHENLIKRCHPEFGDLLITKSGTIGRIAIVDTKIPFSLFVSVALIKLMDNIDRNYLKFFLQNFFNHTDISQQIKGAVVKNFHLEDIRQVVIPLPLLSEQKRIVSKLESIFGRIDSTEKSLDAVLSKIDLLKKSVLKCAFEGKLVPQDPNDEPASVLLERIKKEKTQLEQGESVKRRKRDGK